MRHRLAGHFTVIDTNIEALDRGVLVLNVEFHLVQQREDGVSFRTMEVEKTFDVPPRNDQCVKRRYRVSVTYRISEGMGAD